MKRFVILVLWFFYCETSFSRDFAQDMQKIRETYGKSYVSMSITYSLYNKVTDTKPSEVNSLWLESFGELLHYKGQGIEMLYTTNNFLMVDETEKEMVIDTVTSQYNRPNYDVLPLDTTVSKMKSITLEELNGGIVRYTLIPKEQSETSKIVFEINTINWTITRIELLSGTLYGSGKVVISYTNVVKQETRPANSFKLSDFILVKKGGGYVTTAKYESYKLYHRNNNNFKTK